MNTNERDAAEKWERRGWEIVRGGAPDFLLVKRLAGRIVEARTIEVKTSGDQLKPNQIVWGEALGAYGIPFTVARRFNVGGPIAPLRADEASSGLSPTLERFISECCTQDEAARVLSGRLFDTFFKWGFPWKGKEIIRGKLFEQYMVSRFQRSKLGGRFYYWGLCLKEELHFDGEPIPNV